MLTKAELLEYEYKPDVPHLDSISLKRYTTDSKCEVPMSHSQPNTSKKELERENSKKSVYSDNFVLYHDTSEDIEEAKESLENAEDPENKVIEELPRLEEIKRENKESDASPSGTEIEKKGSPKPPLAPGSGRTPKVVITTPHSAENIPVRRIKKVKYMSYIQVENY